MREINETCHTHPQHEVNHDLYNIPCSSSPIVHPGSLFELPSSSNTQLLYSEQPNNSYISPETNCIPPILVTRTYSPPLSLSESSSQELDLRCADCTKPCTNAHSCPYCSRPVHSICGHPVEGKEGFGCPVYCSECWLNKMDTTICNIRQISKRAQSKQIDRLGKQSRKKYIHTILGRT